MGDPTLAGYMPLRQLNRIEYRNAVTDLFGDARQVDELLPGDVAGTSGFATAGLASEVTVQALQQAAERLAASADVASLTGCVLAAGSSACIDTLLTGFGQRCFRRPLLPQEAAEYSELYAQLTSELGLDFESAARTVIEALLQSPAFLYHWELGPTAPARDSQGFIKLSGYELASRLSFLLWSSIPDQELLQAAASGALETEAGWDTQVRRLLAADKASGTMRNFTLQWLEVALEGTTRSPELYPSFNAERAGQMEDELVSLSTEWYRTGSVHDLFLSGAGDATRLGILTRPGFLTATSNAYEGDPTKRGVVIRKRILCGELVPPPANIPALPPPAPDQTVRERHAMHMSTEPCKSCHQLTDPIGFGLGNYDAIGEFHAEEAGKVVDASGVVAGLDGSDQSFTDVTGLMNLLAESEDARACLARQWMRFGFARSETRADDSSLENAYQAFSTSGFKLSELVAALTKSRSFHYRAPSPGEVVK